MSIFKKFAKAVGKGVKGVTKGVVSVGKGIGKGVGGVAKGTVSFAKGAVGVTGKLVTSPVKLATDIAKGKNVFNALKDTVKRDFSTIKEAGPYALTVMSVIPGIGTGVTAAVTAGLALANGKRIDEALIAGMKGAIPGGPIAQQGFQTGVDILKGKNIGEAALAAARARLPPAAQAGFDAGIAVAKGKNVQDMAVNLALDKAGGILNVAKGKAVGAIKGTIATSPVWKVAKDNVIPGVKGVYSKGVIAAQAVGKVAAMKDEVLKIARQKLPGGAVAQLGFDTAMGIIGDGKGFTEKDIQHVRSQLPNGPAKAAFDTAFNMHVGRVSGKPAPANMKPAAKAAYYSARGAVKLQAPKVMKEAVVKMTVKTPEEHAGLKTAIVEEMKARGAPVPSAELPDISWLEWFWQEVKHYVKGSDSIAVTGEDYHG